MSFRVERLEGNLGLFLTVCGWNVLLGCGLNLNNPTNQEEKAELADLADSLDCVLLTNPKLTSSGALCLLPKPQGARNSQNSQPNNQNSQNNSQNSQNSQQRIIFMPRLAKSRALRLCRDYYHQDKSSSTCVSTEDVNASFDQVQAIDLGVPIQVTGSLSFTAYKTGVDCCSYAICCDGLSILYVDGLNLDIINPIPKQPDLLLTHGSFSISIGESRRVIHAELLKRLRETVVTSKGRIIIPLFPASSAYEELKTLIQQYWFRMNLGKVAKIYATDDFAASQTPEGEGKEEEKEPIHLFNWSLFEQTTSPFVLFCGPGLVSYGDSLRAVKLVCKSSRNLVVLTEYASGGTLNEVFMNDVENVDLRRKLGLQNSSSQIECGVHLVPCGDGVDAKSILQLVSITSPKKVLLVPGVHENGKEDDPEMETNIMLSLIEKELNISCDKLIAQKNGIARFKTHINRPIPIEMHTSFVKKYQNQLGLNNSCDGESRLVRGLLVAKRNEKLQIIDVEKSEEVVGLPTVSLQFVMKRERDKTNVSHAHLSSSTSKKKKKNKKSGSASLSFLLSAPSQDEESEEENSVESTMEYTAEEMQNKTQNNLSLLQEEIHRWMFDVEIVPRSIDTLVIQSAVEVTVNHDWSVQVKWNYEDEELATRVRGICQRIVDEELSKEIQ